ncbi:MAG: DUF5668 domain-containing protein [Acidimicrobiia bacterium]
MNWARAYFGILIVAVGTLLLLDNLDVLDSGDIIGTWWPVAIIFGALLSYFANRRHVVMPLILGLVGGGLLLTSTGVISSLELVFPVLVIVVGLFLIFGRRVGSTEGEIGNSVSSFNLFSGSEVASNSTSFEGGTVGAVFGGAEIDLRHAGLAEGATLDVFVAFGGVEVYVPPGWRVDISGFPLFGGFDNATVKESLPADAPLLRIDATVLFGGLDVRH